MSRRIARTCAFILIYQIEFHEAYDPAEQTGIFFEHVCNPGEDEDLYFAKPAGKTKLDAGFITDAVAGVYNNIPEIDGLIKSNLSGWQIDRINKIDLAIIRLAVCELLYIKNVPHRVSINEAVELAKNFGTDESYQFINGILGRIYNIVGKADG